MKEESFIMVSLKEDNAKKIAQVISNDTCRKILEYLANTKSTATELSKKLEVPLSTIHYNIQQLVASKLVEADEFHYSKKGKEIIHYSLANKYIVIAPKEEDPGFLKKLKEIMPAAAVGLVSTAGLYIYSLLNKTTKFALAGDFDALENRALIETITEESAEVAMDVATGAAKTAEAPLRDSIAQEAINQTSNVNGEIVLWFFLGITITVISYLLISIIRKKLKKQ